MQSKVCVFTSPKMDFFERKKSCRWWLSKCKCLSPACLSVYLSISCCSVCLIVFLHYSFLAIFGCFLVVLFLLPHLCFNSHVNWLLCFPAWHWWVCDCFRKKRVIQNGDLIQLVANDRQTLTDRVKAKSFSAGSPVKWQSKKRL